VSAWHSLFSSLVGSSVIFRIDNSSVGYELFSQYPLWTELFFDEFWITVCALCVRFFVVGERIALVLGY